MDRSTLRDINEYEKNLPENNKMTSTGATKYKIMEKTKDKIRLSDSTGSIEDKMRLKNLSRVYSLVSILRGILTRRYAE
jgi:hypothetical protein